jgi:glycine oxidase
LYSKLINSNYIIIGAGIAGLATAQLLLKQGTAVTLLDRGLVGQESSWAGAGILSPLCPWDYPDVVTDLTNRGAALYPQWVAELQAATGIDPEYDVSGLKILLSLDVSSLGVSSLDISLAQRWCEEHEVRLECQAENLFLPDVAQVRNPRLIQALRKHVEILGGKIVEQCEVLEIATKVDCVQSITTTLGEFRSDNFIVCAGAWSRQVLGQHALQLDIKPMRGQMLLYKFDSPPLGNIILYDGVYLIPRRDGHVLVGSTLEDAGFDKSTTTDACDFLKLRALQILPQLRDMPLIQHWSGLRPASPHNIPTIGRHPHLKNLYVNSGHFRYGVTMAPSSAEILLNEITGIPSALDIAPYQAGWGSAEKKGVEG